MTYSALAKIAEGHAHKKKTYDNVVSALRTAFKFGYKDLPGKFNPALALTTFRMTQEGPPLLTGQARLQNIRLWPKAAEIGRRCRG